MRLSAIFFISLIAAAGAAQNQIKLWTVESMPNPMTDPEACGRDNVKHSAVCDPERIMSATGQAVVEELINNATSIEIAAVLMHYMDISVYRNDVDVAAEKLATGLHNKVQLPSRYNCIKCIHNSYCAAVVAVGSRRCREEQRRLDSDIRQGQSHIHIQRRRAEECSFRSDFG